MLGFILHNGPEFPFGEDHSIWSFHGPENYDAVLAVNAPPVSNTMQFQAAFPTDAPRYQSSNETALDAAVSQVPDQGSSSVTDFQMRPAIRSPVLQQNYPEPATAVNDSKERFRISSLEYPALLKCNHPFCPTQTIFTRPSDLKKHMNKHTRPFICPKHPCKTRNLSFPDKGTLTRHEREVHTSKPFTCPMLQCLRHRSGFARKANLAEHLKRKHGISPSQRASTTSLSPERSISADVGLLPGESCRQLDSRNQEDQLREKLAQLREQRARIVAEIDGDITAVERTLRLLVPES